MQSMLARRQNMTSKGLLQLMQSEIWSFYRCLIVDHRRSRLPIAMQFRWASLFTPWATREGWRAPFPKVLLAASGRLAQTGCFKSRLLFPPAVAADQY